MSQKSGLPLSSSRYGIQVIIALASLLCAQSAAAQLAVQAERNVSRLTNYQNECAIAVNPNNRFQLFASCNHAGPGLFFARSIDRGQTWIYPDADRTLADGDAGQGAMACCDPTLAWDSFGNLYVTYLGSVGSVVTLLSTDGGQTFSNLATFAGNVDQPTVVAENTTAAGAPVAVWIVWNQTNPTTGANTMRARGAAVTGLGAVGAFGAMQTIPGTNNCSFGDVAIAPDGVVVQVCQTPTGGQGPGQLLVNIDADGLGPNNFGASIVATTTSVGGFDFIPPQNVRSIDAEAGLAYDRNPTSPRFGRLYLVYTEEVVNEGNDTDIMVRFSDNDGQNWSNPPVRVNDDAAGRAQFLPKIATNPVSGNIAVCWHDSRAPATNTQMREFCSISTPTPAVPNFFPNVQISTGTSSGSGSNPPAPGQADIQYGDYSGLDYFRGRFHPIWADQSNSQGDNPDGTTTWDAHSSRVTGGALANEGDPHLRTVDGTHYDFQASGEFVSLRGADGFEVQTRQRAVATTFFPGPNPHTGLATCVAVNSAVAARVGNQVVTYQPPAGNPDAGSEMQLRIDGTLTALIEQGVSLSGGGRVARTAVGGMEVSFPNGAHLTATPGFWSSQGVWYVNVNISGADAYEGIMGVVRDGWLPSLPDGSSLGPRPSAIADRYSHLYGRFARAWRVTNASSLFDYPSGMGTEDFTIESWPAQQPPCEVKDQKPAQPVEPEVAKQACEGLADRNRLENCIFDVRVTGDKGFAKTYFATERLERWGTETSLSVDPAPGGQGKPVGFVVNVVPTWWNADGMPSGTVQFFLHDRPVGEGLGVENGQAVWRPERSFNWDNYRVAARYVPDKRSQFLPSTSGEVAFPNTSDTDVYHPR